MVDVELNVNGQAERLRVAARRWVEENYDAHRNTDRLVACFQQAVVSRA